MARRLPLVATGGVVTCALPPPPVGPPPVHCIVPRVVRLTFTKARRKIRRASSSVGRVQRVKKVRRFRGVVIRQSPKAGRRLARGGRVSLVVGR